jgi:peptide/nickel transport system ATP-binding protein
MSTNTTDPAPVIDTRPVLEATDLTKHFVVRSGVRRSRDGGKRVVHAAENVSVSLVPGRIIAVVGESGSGKTTVGRMMARLEIPTKGELKLRGQQVPKRGARALRPFRSEVQMVFQDPFASLNAGHTISYHLERPLLIHGIAKTKDEARTKALELLRTVHLEPAEQYVDKYPTQLSGGQRQRVAIARALAPDPHVIVADEPVSMLDVSIRLSVLNLFGEIARRGHAILYITHDIASARYFADDVMVMYAGQVVEYGPAEQITTDPQHPYTQLLVESAPDPSRRDTRTALAARAGEASSLVTPPSGCRFHPRCPHAMEICSQQQPPKFPRAAGGEAACWLLKDSALPAAASLPNDSEEDA